MVQSAIIGLKLDKTNTKRKKDIGMGRIYSVKKKLTQEQAAEILRELRELERVASAEMSEDLALLTVVAREDDYESVMGNAVNIFSRVGGGAEISFKGFDITK